MVDDGDSQVMDDLLLRLHTLDIPCQLRHYLFANGWSLSLNRRYCRFPLDHLDCWSYVHGSCVFPQTVSTLRGSYCESKGRCLIRVFTLGGGIFPVAYAGSHKVCSAVLGPGIFPVFDMRFDRAGWHKVCSAVLVCGFFPVNFRIKWPFWYFDMRFDCAGPRKCSSAFWAVRWAHSGTRAGSHKAFLCVLLLVFSCHVSSPVARFIYAICCFGSQCLWSNCLTPEPTHRIGYTIYLHKVVWNVALNKQTHS